MRKNFGRAFAIPLIMFAAAAEAGAAECTCTDCERRVAELEKRLSALERRVAVLERNSGAAKKKSLWGDDTFNYLAIGNSLTKHGVCKYWWNPVGMAASDADHDYFHLVRRGLEKRFGEVRAHAVNFSAWEITAHDRDQTLAKLDGLLDERLSLVTIQLGENVKDFGTLPEDYVSLIEYVKKKTRGKAQIIVVGDFWRNESVRAEAAEKCGADYASLKEAFGDPRYRSRIGAVVFDPQGKKHVVRHAGVAKHPGDEGMAFIAEKILEKVRK